MLASAGLVLSLSSLLMGARFSGYQLAVMLLQVGGVSLVLGMYYRLNGKSGSKPKSTSLVSGIYDLESGVTPR